MKSVLGLNIIFKNPSDKLAQDISDSKHQHKLPQNSETKNI
jgi:hypothetical protein